jgi:hypothetical protein
LRLVLRFAGPGADPAAIGAQVAGLLLHGLAADVGGNIGRE